MPKHRLIYAFSIKEATSLFNTIHKIKNRTRQVMLKYFSEQLGGQRMLETKIF